ncbi:tetratricopeptide repeat protein [Bartonella sp. A05]|uniref:tetratricopeptide repeat protein n=1 Tax=Bartonella sp. A05 TaxID=2967261 RepID=UPI0022A98FF4|nr:tetratricopeptide repeat protein [Bartonella sp. A05]MCZ2203672.1 hypothetical protein [Bartonella sp. A05]
MSKKLCVYFSLIFMVCFGSSAQSRMHENNQLFVERSMQDQNRFIERDATSVKDEYLEWLLHRIQMVLVHNDQEKTENQLHQFFEKGGALFYVCPSDNFRLDAQFQTFKREDENRFRNRNQKYDAGEKNDISGVKKSSSGIKNDISDAKKPAFDVKNHGENKQAGGMYEKNGRPDEARRSKNLHDLSSPKALYKTGYHFILSARYGEAEKVFCAFQNLYRQDPLSGDALFWLAESLLGQKRYREAAQMYLTVWHEDKKTLYGPEILLKLAMSMAALDQHGAACALFADIQKRYKTLESVFYQRLKKEQSHSKCPLN